MMRPPHIQHINPMPPQAATHHIANIPPQQQQQQQPLLNMSTGQQPHNHMMHNHQNYHQNRSNNQHNHHQQQQQQRMNYGQNRPNFHNGSHNMHNIANMSTNIVQSQQKINKINKIDVNCGIPLQSNAQQRYKSIDATNLANQSSSASTTSSSHHSAQKITIQLASNKENVQNVDRSDMNRGCVDDSTNALNVIATSTTSSKAKTPMCLINELVRSNKLKHQYRVTDERGPSHDRLYTVVLELGDERYSAQSKTIKGAQQAAAAAALETTNYKQPEGRTQRGMVTRHTREKYAPNNTITPTVQLNALAMKRGIPTNYSYQYPKSHNEQALNIARNTRNLKGNNNNTNNNNKMRFRDNSRNNHMKYVHRTTEDDPYRVTVTIGDRQFSGTGLTMQSAKHDAAAKALAEFNDESTRSVQSNVSSNFNSSEKSMSTDNGDVVAENTVDRIKSAISVVQEIAQKRDLPIRFVVDSETGPAHMKHFIIKCSVGEMETIGEGNSKKAAKKNAAENMLTELNKLPPVRVASDIQSNGRRKNFPSKRNIAAPNSRQPQVQQENAQRKGTAATAKDLNTSTLSTDTNATDENEVSNPISMLLRLQQATKQNEPIYTVVGERGSGNRKEFTMEVSCNGLMGRGIGNSKKIAKREAAKSVLIQLGYNSDAAVVNVGNMTAAAAAAAAPVPTPTQTGNAAVEKGRKVTFTGSKVYNETGVQSVGGAAGRQLVPGMFLMKNPENNKKAKNSQSQGINYTTTATIAKELLDAGTSPTAEAMISKTSPVKKAPTEEVKPTVVAEVSPTKMETNNNVGETKQPTTQSHGGIRATDQLLYLAQLLKFEVQFDDFPRGNHKDYLTLASLNTDPPQMFHGSGSSAEESKNQAALAALKALSELGLDNVKKPKSILSNGKSN